MLKAVEISEPWRDDCPAYLVIPESGTEIDVQGNYPQR